MVSRAQKSPLKTPKTLLAAAKKSDIRATAQLLSFAENNLGQAIEFLSQQKHNPALRLGITGPPGAGKSSLINALVGYQRAMELLLLGERQSGTPLLRYADLEEDSDLLEEMTAELKAAIRNMKPRSSDDQYREAAHKTLRAIFKREPANSISAPADTTASAGLLLTPTLTDKFNRCP